MRDLVGFATHARAMSTADHKPECRVWDGKGWGRWLTPDPDCGGCVTTADRALWTRLADETDAYLDRHVEETLL